MIAPHAMASARRQAGVSLIELMISLTIGLVILGALTAAYLGSRGAYRTNENLARMQENGRFALDLLTEDVRLAGFVGCRSRTLTDLEVINVARPAVASITGGFFRGADDALQGFENGSGWTNPTTITRAAGDVLVVRRGGGGIELSANADIPNGRVTIRNNGLNFRKGDYVALGTCGRVAFFRVSNDPPQGVTATNVDLEHAANITGAGFTAADGNGSNGIAASNLLLAGSSFELAARPMAYRFGELNYFIGTNPAGRPALYRATRGGATEELVDNVEDMEILYGVDTDGNLFADTYETAATVAAASQWPQVVSVRVSLLVASPEIGVASNASQFALRDTSGDGVADVQTGADTRLRQVFTSTISLRNRAQ